MNPELVVAVIGGILALSSVSFFAYRKLPKRIRMHYNVDRWRTIQLMLRDKDNWPVAIVKADDLLDDMLKHQRKDGKTMGERMVTCQNVFSDNDAIWKAHKLANKLREQRNILEVKLKEDEVKAAMLAFGKGMKDLGAL